MAATARVLLALVTLLQDKVPVDLLSDGAKLGKRR